MKRKYMDLDKEPKESQFINRFKQMSSVIIMAAVDGLGPSWKRVIVKNVNKWVRLLKERGE